MTDAPRRKRDTPGMGVNARPTEQSRTSVSAELLDMLRSSLRRRVVGPSDTGFDEGRRLWNGAIDRRPSAIVHAMDGTDVAAALGTARSLGVPVSVRGGGHNVAGSAIVDEGVMIHLGAMNHVTVQGPLGAGGWRCDARRPRHRDASPRPRRAFRHRHHDRRRRPHARRRHRLADASARPDHRSAVGGGRGPARRRADPGVRNREPRSVLGDPRRRGQLRGRHRVHVRGRAVGRGGRGGPDPIPARRRAGDPAPLPRPRGRSSDP